jgi:hypothetical protein
LNSIDPGDFQVTPLLDFERLRQDSTLIKCAKVLPMGCSGTSHAPLFSPVEVLRLHKNRLRVSGLWIPELSPVVMLLSSFKSILRLVSTSRMDLSSLKLPMALKIPLHR